jgi:U3 small nucleolar ribonucleoprotein protein IMP3
MRPLKFHEKKLLKKVNLYEYKGENNLREIKVLRKYHVQRREDYRTYVSVMILYLRIFTLQKICLRYNKIVGKIKKTINALKDLDPRDPFRQQTTDKILEKLWNMGLIPTQRRLEEADKVTVSTFCRYVATVWCMGDRPPAWVASSVNATSNRSIPRQTPRTPCPAGDDSRL